jgi:hypothetical protein
LISKKEIKKTIKTEVRKVIKRIDYFAESKMRKRLKVVKIDFKKDKKRARSAEVKLKNTALARVLKLTKKVEECISYVNESPEGAEI